jgi:hypothetical protein
MKIPSTNLVNTGCPCWGRLRYCSVSHGTVNGPGELICATGSKPCRSTSFIPVRLYYNEQWYRYKSKDEQYSRSTPLRRRSALGGVSTSAKPILRARPGGTLKVAFGVIHLIRSPRTNGMSTKVSASSVHVAVCMLLLLSNDAISMMSTYSSALSID